MSDINIGALTEVINNKADKDLKNVDINSGADAVIEYQVPTADNDYTGYRKYASGYVEIWGTKTGMSQREYVGSITLPITMADTRYACFVSAWSNRGTDIDWNFTGGCTPKTTTKFSFSLYGLGTTDLVTGMSWSVKGMAAA